jgi:hypothetical protein
MRKRLVCSFVLTIVLCLLLPPLSAAQQDRHVWAKLVDALPLSSLEGVGYPVEAGLAVRCEVPGPDSLAVLTSWGVPPAAPFFFGVTDAVEPRDRLVRLPVPELPDTVRFARVATWCSTGNGNPVGFGLEKNGRHVVYAISDMYGEFKLVTSVSGRTTPRNVVWNTSTRRLAAAQGASTPTGSSPARRATGSARKARASAEERGYYLGPRGGCYTYTSSGRKRYVERSLCN